MRKVGEGDIIGGGKKKQEITVSEKWKCQGDLMGRQHREACTSSCYQLNQFVVWVFMGRRHLSWPPNSESMYDIDDVSNVDDTVDNEKIETLVAAKVIGVHEVDTFYVCIF